MKRSKTFAALICTACSRWDAVATVTPNGKYMLFNRDMDDENTDIYLDAYTGVPGRTP